MASSPRRALLTRPARLRWLIRYNSASDIVPFSPSSSRSLYSVGSYTPSASASRHPPSAHSSSSWYQSFPERARRDISVPSTRPTCPNEISATRRWKPTRCSALDPDLPRSSPTCPGRHRSTQPGKPPIPAPPPCPPAHTAAAWTLGGPPPAAAWTAGRTPPPGVHGAKPPSCSSYAPTASPRPRLTAPPWQRRHRRHRLLALGRLAPAGHHRQPVHRHPTPRLRQRRPHLAQFQACTLGAPAASPSHATTHLPAACAPSSAVPPRRPCGAGPPAPPTAASPLVVAYP